VKKVKVSKSKGPNENQNDAETIEDSVENESITIENSADNVPITNEATNPNEITTSNASIQDKISVPKTKKRVVKKIKLSQRKNSTYTGDEIRTIQNDDDDDYDQINPMKDSMTNPQIEKKESTKKVIVKSIHKGKKTKTMDGDTTDSQNPIEKTDVSVSDVSDSIEDTKLSLFDSPILNLKKFIKEQNKKKKSGEKETEVSEIEDDPFKKLNLGLLQSFGQLKKRNEKKIVKKIISIKGKLNQRVE
jgi:hypothetical protein